MGPASIPPVTVLPLGDLMLKVVDAMLAGQEVGFVRTARTSWKANVFNSGWGAQVPTCDLLELRKHLLTGSSDLWVPLNLIDVCRAGLPEKVSLALEDMLGMKHEVK